MNRSRISDRHYFLALAIPIVVVASWWVDTRSTNQRSAQKKQSKIISCGTNSIMRDGIDMIADNVTRKTGYGEEMTIEKYGAAKNEQFTKSHSCPHGSGPGVAICMLAGHKRRFLKIVMVTTLEEEHYYS